MTFKNHFKKMRKWLVIETEKDYKEVTTRFEEIRVSLKGSPELAGNRSIC